MDGYGYVTDLLRAQERTSDHIHVTNQMFNKFYKAPKISKKTKYNKLLNDTVKNSSPQFYVEQAFNTDECDIVNDRYTFKLDPSFLSCNSVYKTIALRGIFMKPKRYVLQYMLDMNVTLPASTTALEEEREPTFRYDSIKSDRAKKVTTIEATVTDADGDAYQIHYEQVYNPKAGAYIETTPKTLRLTHNNVAIGSGQINTNKIGYTDSHDNSELTFEFHPYGLVTITKKYLDQGNTIIEAQEFHKDEEWNRFRTSCTMLSHTRVTQSAPINVKIPFNVTLLPENSIEVFAYEVATQINNQLKQNSNDHIKQCEVRYDYESSCNKLTFTYVSNEDKVSVQARFVPIDDKHRAECVTFNNILNQTDYDIDPEYKSETVFNNVWNREYFFVHASYMNVVQYNQLGRTGEIYPKPTKLTRYSSTIPDIEFWTSLNGKDPFVLQDQDFEVDLALAATLNNADITF